MRYDLRSSESKVIVSFSLAASDRRVPFLPSRFFPAPPPNFPSLNVADRLPRYVAVMCGWVCGGGGEGGLHPRENE